MLLYSVSDVGRMLGVTPAQISQLFYERRLPDDLAPVVAGRRIIGVDAIPLIVAALRRRGMGAEAHAAQRALSMSSGGKPATAMTKLGSLGAGMSMMTQGGAQ
jgi:hypothetical protein